MGSIELVAFDGWHIPNARIPGPSSGEIALATDMYRMEVASSTRLTGPTGEYNCFGLVFAARRSNVGVPTAPCSIDELLVHDGFDQVAIPQVGDVIVYRDDSGEIEHAGFVRGIDPVVAGGRSVVRVWSMWGGLGEFEHGETACPYRGRTEYWRPRAPR